MQTLKFKILNCLIVGMLVFVAVPVFAAEISFDAKTNEIGVGQQFLLDVSLNTENEEINALEGNISFPVGLLELKEIRAANSIINFWIEQPRVTSDGQIIFSGITPGGYRGEKGLLFSLLFLSKKEGQGVLSLQEVKALQNDGKGTNASLHISDFQFLISKQTPLTQNPISEIKDNELPESFVPEIANDPALFDGRWFVVFATQDKGTGIASYEVKETRQRILGMFSKWVSAESPYMLEDQELKSYIFVKAIDKAGNVRVTNILPKNPLRWYANYENLLILIIIGLIVIAYTIRKFLWRRLKM